jgi:hypothetical protein
MYCPYYGASDEIQDEFAGYAALMALAMNAVNSTKYANHIAKTKTFLQWMALDDGRVYDCVDKDGILWIAKTDAFDPILMEEAYGFLSVASALALLAGA